MADSKLRKLNGRITGGLIGTAVIVPGMASLFVIILYLYRGPHGDSSWITGTRALGIGTAVAICAWAALALLVRARLTSVETANTSVYNELLEQYHGISSRIETLQPPENDGDDGPARSAIAEATAQLETCRQDLGLVPDRLPATGTEWVLATGYAAVWRRLHRAQEALLLVEPTGHVIGTGLLDVARLENSTVPGREHLLRQVRTAIVVLDPDARRYLAQSEETDRGAGTANPEPSEGEDAARVVLRNASRIINEFRDDRRDGLIRARNNLLRTVFVTGLAAYILLGLALIREVDELALVAMCSFYLVGAILGLFKQLGQASSVDTVKEGDYGLSTARLLHTPLFSGLAAVGGVVLLAVVGAVVPANGAPDIPKLREIFDLGVNQFGLVSAAAFGLTPNLLSQRLVKQAEQYKDDLKSTEASGATSTSSATSATS